MASVQVLIIDPVLRKLGEPSPTTKQRKNALADLNAMLGSLSARRHLIYQVTRENFPLVINDAEYTIGSAGDFSTVRPTRIVDAYLRDGSTDYPLTPRNLSDYNDIATKTDSGRPTTIYYLPEHPLGKILFNLEPDRAYTLFIDSWKPLVSLAKISTALALPPEYEEFLIYNLIPRLATEYDEVVTPEVAAIAQQSMDSVMGVNAEPSPKVSYSFLPISRARYDVTLGGVRK